MTKKKVEDFQKNVLKLLVDNPDLEKNYILWNLREASEQLAKTIKGLEKQKDYGLPEFWVEMAHTYHHLNTAWNARHIPAKRTNNITDKDFNEWGRFPKDLPMMELE